MSDMTYFGVLPFERDEQGENAFLALVTQDPLGMQLNPPKFFPQLDLPYIESDPA